MLVSTKNDKVLWRMGGKSSDFTAEDSALDFRFQHDAKIINDDMTEMTLFDNNANENTDSVDCASGKCSRGLHLKIDYDNMKVELLHEYLADGFISGAMGGTTKLASGNVQMCWGLQPYMTEATEGGEVVFNLQFGPLGQGLDRRLQYRVTKADFPGQPQEKPSVVVTDAGSANAIAYFSHNGATDLVSWALVRHMAFLTTHVLCVHEQHSLTVI